MHTRPPQFNEQEESDPHGDRFKLTESDTDLGFSHGAAIIPQSHRRTFTHTLLG
jgi:hypothetical protein